jgi:hypothetical protein
MRIELTELLRIANAELRQMLAANHVADMFFVGRGLPQREEAR